jgi:hypothetical protein
VEGTEDLGDLWDQVVALYFTPNIIDFYPEGIYVGRLLLDGWSSPLRPDDAGMRANLFSLRRAEWALQDIGHYTEEGALRGIASDDHVALQQRWAEIRARALSKFRLPKGTKILGKVIGRLSGHLSGEPKK